MWDESAVLRDIALATLKRLYRKRGGPCYFILDDTQVLKRAKKMEAVGRLYHHATGRYGTGHTILGISVTAGSSAAATFRRSALGSRRRVGACTHAATQPQQSHVGAEHPPYALPYFSSGSKTLTPSSAQALSRRTHEKHER